MTYHQGKDYRVINLAELTALKKPCSSIVYKNTTDGYTYAVDTNGAELKRVLSSTNTDEQLIQKALVSGDGTCYVAPGTYNISSTITASTGCGIRFDTGTTIKPTSSFNVLNIEPGSYVSGGIIDVKGLNFSHSCILFDGSYNFDISNYKNTFVENISLRNDTCTGTAIKLDSSGSKGHIWNCLVRNIDVNSFKYGIYFYRSGAYGANWINGNTFSLIWGQGCENFICMENSGGTAGTDIDGNLFSNVQHQSTKDTITFLTLNGRLNQFRGLDCWDWQNSSNPSNYAISVVSGSNGNFMIVSGATINDNGTNDIIFSQTSSISNMLTLNKKRIKVGARGGSSCSDGTQVAHTCGATPTSILCNGTVAGEIISVATIGATYFTVNIKKTDGSTGTNQIVYWSAEF